jgi:hypothetical protein
MRVLLRNIPTGLYVQALDAWTTNPSEALDLKSMSQAMRFVEKAGYTGMELTLVSDHPCHLTAVPLEPAGSSVAVANQQ